LCFALTAFAVHEYWRTTGEPIMVSPINANPEAKLDHVVIAPNFFNELRRLAPVSIT
jgi:hypothetical protein